MQLEAGLPFQHAALTGPHNADWHDVLQECYCAGAIQRLLHWLPCPPLWLNLLLPFEQSTEMQNLSYVPGGVHAVGPAGKMMDSDFEVIILPLGAVYPDIARGFSQHC